MQVTPDPITHGSPPGKYAAGPRACPQARGQATSVSPRGWALVWLHLPPMLDGAQCPGCLMQRDKLWASVEGTVLTRTWPRDASSCAEGTPVR